jgi:hypothetical protein
MTDVELNVALCRIDALTDIERAGLDALASMTATELDEFAAKVDEAWQSNIDAMQTAQAAVREAVLDQARVEVECGNAAHERNPVYPVLNADEIAQVYEMTMKVAAARTELTEARQRFKAGVTEEQLTDT